MRKPISRSRALACALSALLLLATACSDVGDSSAVPGQDSGSVSGEDATVTPTADGGADSTVIQSTAEAGAEDAGVVTADTGVSAAADSGVDDDAASDDAGMLDSGSIEDASADTNVAFDSSVADSEAPDTSVADSGAVADSSVSDSGAADTSVADAADASAPTEAGASDAGKGPLVPCTASGQTDCVECQGNTASTTCTATSCICTPTEAALVQYDITKGYATAAGPDSTSGCYCCLYQVGALDDVFFGDNGHECGDLPAAEQAACVTTMDCILSTACAAAGDVGTCYCGTAPTSGTCTSGGANGACKAVEAAGLGFAASDGLDILKNFTSTTLASGVANNIFQEAISNSCPVCLQ